MSDSNVATLPKRASISIGTVIVLKSGGAPMTVTERTTNTVKAIWHDTDGCLNEAVFPTSAIEARDK